MEKSEYDSRPSHLLDNGHDVSLWVERENTRFKTLKRNIPLSLRNASRHRSQGEEFDRITPEDPIRATHDGGVSDAEHVAENLDLLFERIQCCPPPAVRFEGRVAI